MKTNIKNRVATDVRLWQALLAALVVLTVGYCIGYDVGWNDKVCGETHESP